jgi:hypothetical protein
MLFSSIPQAIPVSAFGRVILFLLITRAVDPDSIGFVDPDSEYGSRRTKMTNKKRKK